MNRDDVVIEGVDQPEGHIVAQGNVTLTPPKPAAAAPKAPAPWTPRPAPELRGPGNDQQAAEAYARIQEARHDPTSALYRAFNDDGHPDHREAREIVETAYRTIYGTGEVKATFPE